MEEIKFEDIPDNVNFIAVWLSDDHLWAATCQKRSGDFYVYHSYIDDWRDDDSPPHEVGLEPTYFIKE